MDDSIRNDRIRMRVAETDLRYKQDTTLMKQRLFIQKQQSDMRSLELSVYIWILVCVILLTIAAFIYFYQKKTTSLSAGGNTQQDHQPPDGKYPQPRITPFYL